MTIRRRTRNRNYTSSYLGAKLLKLILLTVFSTSLIVSCTRKRYNKNEAAQQHGRKKSEEDEAPSIYFDIKEANRKLQYKIHSLEHMDPIPFYMYNHPNITLETLRLNIDGIYLNRIGAEALNDLATIHALNSSSWKTSNPNDAKLFIIPIPMGRIFISRNLDYYKTSFSTLVNDPIFQRTMGHRHVLPVSPFILFRGDWLKMKNQDPMKVWMPLLWNVTVAQSYDQNGVVNAVNNKKHDLKEYTPVFESLYSLNKKTFSVGLSGGTNFPLRDIHIPKRWEKFHFPLTLASTEKFYNSSNYIFYHTRQSSFYNNSTIFRQAPITNITMDAFPKSSIGFGIDDKETWFEAYRDSKFCLCIRGYVRLLKCNFD